MQDILSYRSVLPHLKNLRGVGFYQIDPNETKLKRYLHRLYMAFILLLNSFYTGQEMIRIYQVRDDADKIMDTMFLMLTYSDCIYKQVVLWKQQDKVEELLNVLKGPHFNPDEPDYRTLLLKRERQSRLLLRTFNMTAFATCLLWVLYPMILYAQRKPVEFAIWLPFDPNMSPQFYIALGYVWVQTSLLAVGNTTIDAFISFFFAQCKTQLSIIRLDLENIVKKCKIEAKDTSKPFAVVFHRRFRNILLHYDEIVLLCNKTQNIFGGAVLYFFLISAWIICTSAYRMLSIEPISMEFTSMILYIICVLTEIFLYCYYGHEVSYESDKLMESAFAMDWHEIPLKERYSVIIFMERIKRPIIPMAGLIIPLSNSTFVSILRSSYTFYAFLKNTD